MTKTILFYDGDRAYIGRRSWDGEVSQIETLRIHPGRYIRIDDGCIFPQLCVGGRRMGHTIEADTNEERIAQSLARDCEARLYKTQAGYNRALANMEKADEILRSVY